LRVVRGATRNHLVRAEARARATVTAWALATVGLRTKAKT